MVFRKSKYFAIFFFLIPCLGYAQYGEVTGSTSFYYDDDDKKKDELNFHNVFYSGFSNSLVKIEEDISLPILPAIYFEYKYLIFPKNDYINLSANIHPELALFTWFLVKIPASININFLNEATTEHKNGTGLSLGIGYEYLTTTFDYYEHSLFLRGGFKIDNVRIMYQYKTAKELNINHCISVGVQLDL